MEQLYHLHTLNQKGGTSKMFNSILNILLFRKTRVNKVSKRFIDILESEFAEEFLEILLKLMALMFCLDKNYRRNIKNFEAKYMFKDRDAEITISAIFKNSRLKVYEKQIDNTNITIIFKDQKVLMNFILSPKMDILSAVLNQDVTYEGNLNYLSKFAYMANHLRLRLT